MRWIITILVWSVTLIFTPVFARVNLVENGTVTIEYMPSENIYISNAVAYQDGNEILITGVVKRHANSSSTVDGHVHVFVLDPSGIILTQGATHYIPRIVRRKGSRESRFTIRFPIVSPKGTTIRVDYHKD